MNTTTPELLVSVERAGQMLGIGRSLAWQLVKDGTLPSAKISSRRLVSVRSLQEYAESLTEAAR